ncbi:MAG: hypothetical protein GXC76_10665 [Rhodanobacteraceae bacterium]|jgi:hypothetical protein|nr:hypothetical protein [Rhodanobacteraceae bacterium]
MSPREDETFALFADTTGQPLLQGGAGKSSKPIPRSTGVQSFFHIPETRSRTMPRPRKPTSLHILSGTADHNPARMRERAAEPIDDRPLGPPPESMRPDQRAAWLEIERLAPWLAYADRIAVEVTAVLLARFRVDPGTMPPALLTRLETLLGRLGLTPSDRSRVRAQSPSASANRFVRNGIRPS